ncbi:hypothetical protein K492DRAFT_127378 [Lichtheimia hyalospora FSU 10163]|nr:hypothetical protein K492DRAFT_127378 [Lichtheimia hyalospora FSU 10163]
MNPEPADVAGWHKKLVGKVVLKDNEETALGTDEVVREKDLPKPYRVIPPDSAVTMDYRPERLNIFVDSNFRVNTVGNG